jgi:hypothetical protein
MIDLRYFLSSACFVYITCLVGISCNRVNNTIDLRLDLDVFLLPYITATKPLSLIDLDGKSILVEKGRPKKGIAPRSCYQVIRDGNATSFCYPQVLIPVHAKCGTSAMYRYLQSHDQYFRGLTLKENCHRKTYFDFFAMLGKNFLLPRPHIEINGCIQPDRLLVLHRLLQPTAAYVYMVRNTSDHAWSAYNYWCISSIESCATPDAWTTPESKRSPELFENYSTTPGSLFECPVYYNMFSQDIERFYAVFGRMPLVLSIDALESEKYKSSQLQRLNAYLNHELKIHIVLNTNDFSRFNAGAVLSNRGSRKIASANITTTTIAPGTYEVSCFRTMLPESMQRIRSCWHECAKIANWSSYPYDCVQ